LFAFIALFLFANAQLSVKGRFEPLRNLGSSFVQRLAPLDNQRLRFEEDNSHGGYQFGYPMDLVLNSDSAGEWTRLSSGGLVWTLTLKSSTALSLGVTFENFALPEGSELYLMGEDVVKGAYTSLNNPENGLFTTFPIDGSHLTIQYFHPVEQKMNLPVFKIIKVTHGYKSVLGFGSSGRCNINSACDDGTWSDQIRSVGMLLSSFGSRFCSGALINNVANDKTQLFLTANHCSVGTSDLIMFNYQSPQCSPNADGQTDKVVGKIAKLASNANSDFTIVQIGEEIPQSWNVYLSGFSAENVPPKSMVGIHHPSGDVKKICYANKAGVADRWSAAEPGLWHWRVTSWDEGTTEPGSSGSPLFDQSQRIIGQLHGGAASCTNVNGYDSYGAVWASWSVGLSKYLDPQNTGLKSSNGTNLY